MSETKHEDSGTIHDEQNETIKDVLTSENEDLEATLKREDEKIADNSQETSQIAEEEPQLQIENRPRRKRQPPIRYQD